MRPFRLLLLPLLLPLVAALACGDPGGRAADDSALPGGADALALCDTIDNSFRCARAIEAARLPTAPRAERRGDTLVLGLAAGDTARLVDRPGEGGGVAYFSYQDHWPEGWFVVQEQHYEGSEFLLIDDGTGDRTSVPDRPLRAPGGERFAVLSFDLAAGYAPNTLQVWRLEEAGPTRVWSIEPETWGPTDGRWTGPETLMFTRRCGPGQPGSPDCGGTDTLRRVDGAWSLARERSGG